MFLVDSDTDNSIVIEHNRHKKLTCLKDTPLKIDSKAISQNDADKSMDFDNDADETDNDDQKSDNEENKSKPDESVDNTHLDTTSKSPQKSVSSTVNHENDHSDLKISNDFSHNDESNNNDDDDVNNDESDDDGPDEDLMVMSRATRMSIMGVIPKDDESDDSDYIQSDEVNTPALINKLSDYLGNF